MKFAFAILLSTFLVNHENCFISFFKIQLTLDRSFESMKFFPFNSWKCTVVRRILRSSNKEKKHMEQDSTLLSFNIYQQLKRCSESKKPNSWSVVKKDEWRTSPKIAAIWWCPISLEVKPNGNRLPTIVHLSFVVFFLHICTIDIVLHLRLRIFCVDILRCIFLINLYLWCFLIKRKFSWYHYC